MEITGYYTQDSCILGIPDDFGLGKSEPSITKYVTKDEKGTVYIIAPPLTLIEVQPLQGKNQDALIDTVTASPPLPDASKDGEEEIDSNWSIKRRLLHSGRVAFSNTLYSIQGKGTLVFKEEENHEGTQDGINWKTLTLTREVKISDFEISIEMIEVDLSKYRLIVADYLDFPAEDGNRKFKSLTTYASVNRAVIAMNAGYYRFCPDDCESINLNQGGIISKGKTISPFEDWTQRAIFSAYFGIDKDGHIRVGKITRETMQAFDWQEFIQTGPLAIQGGKLNNGLKSFKSKWAGDNERNLTAIGTRNGKIVLITTHVNIPYSLRGINYFELALLMQERGLDNMVFLDSGNSSAMWYEGHINNNGDSVYPNAILIGPR